MSAWVGQYCIYVHDLDEAVTFYEGLGLDLHQPHRSRQHPRGDRREPGQGRQAPAGPAQRPRRPHRDGQRVLEALRGHQRHRPGVDRGHRLRSRDGVASRAARPVADVDRLREGPQRLPRRVRPTPPLDGRRRTTYTWLDQYCIYVTDLERSIAFYELLGLECTSRTDIPGHKEAILENPGRGGKLQLAQQLDNDAPIDMGTSMWKLYVNTDGCEALHRTAVAAGHTSLVEPMSPERWPVTISFLADPDGYQVELVERHPDPA